MHFEEYGDEDAPLLVFLHGGGVGTWMWDKQISYFSPRYHCVAIDLPEHGRSKDGANFTISSSAEKVFDIVERISKGKKVVMIGFSLGAQIIIQILSVKPNLIDVAMINSALARPIPRFQKLIGPSVKMTFPFVKNKFFSKLQAKTLYIDEGHFETYYEETNRMKPDTLIRVMEENMNFAIPETFKHAKGNILVTVGEKERNFMKKSAIELVSHNSNCKGIIISNIGHGFPLAKPELFNQILESWIEEGVIRNGATFI